MLECGGRCTWNKWWCLELSLTFPLASVFFLWMVPQKSELAVRVLDQQQKTWRWKRRGPGGGWQVFCLETAGTRKVCKVSFPVILELLYSFPCKVPLASTFVTHGWHHILLFLTPCSNRSAIHPFLKSIPSVRSLQRKHSEPSTLHYQFASVQHLASSCVGSSSGSPAIVVPDLFFLPLPLPWRILGSFLWKSFCTGVEVISFDPFEWQAWFTAGSPGPAQRGLHTGTWFCLFCPAAFAMSQTSLSNFICLLAFTSRKWEVEGGSSSNPMALGKVWIVKLAWGVSALISLLLPGVMLWWKGWLYLVE